MGELKAIFDVENGGAISGKVSNGRTTRIFEFVAPQPRTVTSNATYPHEFAVALPPSLFAVVPHETGLVRPDGRAVLKRVCFYYVQTNLMPVDVSDE